MARIRHDTLCHVVGCCTHYGRHHRPERLLSTNSKHRHFQSRTHQERAVVDRVLVERGELRKARMHRTWKRIESRIVLACRFTEAIGRGGELVPEPIEIDALTPGNKPLHVRPSE